VHVHGGAWRIGSKDNSGFVAQGLSGSGAAVAVLGFGLAPATSLPRMAGQVRDAVAFLLRRPDAPASLTVSGHSSGAHLAALLLDPAWQKRAGLPEQGIRGAVLASGPYDLEPVRLSARNEYLSLSEADVAEFSPALHLPADPPPLRIFCGDGELLEFRRQTEAFAQRLGQPFEVLNGCNHFDVYDLFGDPASPIARAIRDMTV
jgi:arylformamidase